MTFHFRILTDFFQFALGMTGMVIASIYIVGLPEIGGLDQQIDVYER